MTTTLALSGLSALGSKREDNLPRHVKRLQAFIFGAYKSGKTVAAHGMPGTRTIDFDEGMLSVEWAIREDIIKKKLSDIAYETILPSGRRDVDYLNATLEQIDTWIDEEDIPPEKWDKPYPQKWDTLIVDSMTGFNRGVIVLALSENKGLGLSKSLDAWKKGGGLHVMPARIQDFGGASQMTTDFISELRLFPKNIIVTAHEYPEYKEDGSLLSVKPLLWGQARSNVPSQFDEVWYAHTAGSRAAPKFLLQTTPDPIHKCGSRLGCLEPLEETDFEKIKARVSEYYRVDKDWLWSTAHGRKEVDAEREKMLEEVSGRV